MIGVVPSYMVTLTAQETGFMASVSRPLIVKEVAPSARVVSISVYPEALALAFTVTEEGIDGIAEREAVRASTG